MLGTPRRSDYVKKFRLHHGGNWVKDHISSDIWVGGEFVDFICTRSECRNLGDIDVMFRKKCNLKHGVPSYSYMIGGLKFDLNTDDEVKFLWSHMPTSGDCMHHVYCFIPSVPPTEPTVDEQPPVTQETIIPSQEPPAEDLSQGIDLGPDVSFSKYFEDLTPTKVSTFLSSPNTRKCKKKKISFSKPIAVPYGSPVEVHEPQLTVDLDFGTGTEQQPQLPVDSFVMHSWETLMNAPIIQVDNQSEPQLDSEVDTQTEAHMQTEVETESANEEPHMQTENAINFDQIEDDIGGEPPNYDSEEDIEDDDSEDDDYQPSLSDSEEDHEDQNVGDLQPEEQCLAPDLRSFSDKSFDCTEVSIRGEGRRPVNNEVPLEVGQQWNTMAECKQYLRLHALKKKFEFYFKKNNVDKLILRCKQDENCPWKCYIRRLNDGHTAACRSLVALHTCVNTTEEDPKKKNTMCNAKWIAEMIQVDMKLHNFSAREIVKLVWNKFNLKIKYWQAWSARTFALEKVHGNYEDSYMKVPELCRHLVNTNPGSLVKWTVDSENKFDYFCVAYKASLDGWRNGCRPIVGLDGCFLKGKYRGTCLVAIGMDGNNGMFPLGFFVCGKEDGDNWDAFLEVLAPELKKHQLPLTIMSDRAPSLVAAVEKHLGGSNQRFCFRHIFKNMCKWWRGGLIRYQAWVTAEVYTEHEFDHALAELEKSGTGTTEYLLEIGPNMWARSHFGVESKCNHLTNNFTECFNSFILETRDKPICSMVVGVTFLLMKIMYDRKTMSAQWDDNDLLPRVKSTIEEYSGLENEYLTQPIGDGEYCVVHYSGKYWTINLAAHECTCKEWQLTGVPCVHGVHLIRNLRLQMNEYCHEFVKAKMYKAAYEHSIKPVPYELTWAQSNEFVVLPPVITRSAGRPKKNRYKGVDELENHEKKNAHKCTTCGAFGHNKRSCQGGPVRGGRGGTRGRGRVGRPPTNAGNRGDESSVNRGGNRGGRAVRGGRGRTNRGRGSAARGSASVPIDRPTSIQIPTQKGPITIQLPPPPQPKSTSKRKKVFHPPSKDFMP